SEGCREVFPIFNTFRVSTRTRLASQTLGRITDHRRIYQRSRGNVPSLGTASGKILQNGLYPILEWIREVRKNSQLVIERRFYSLLIRCSHVLGENPLSEWMVVLDPFDRLDGCLHKIQDRKSIRLNSSHEWISYAV